MITTPKPLQFDTVPIDRPSEPQPVRMSQFPARVREPETPKKPRRSPLDEEFAQYATPDIHDALTKVNAERTWLADKLNSVRSPSPKVVLQEETLPSTIDATVAQYLSDLPDAATREFVNANIDTIKRLLLDALPINLTDFMSWGKRRFENVAKCVDGIRTVSTSDELKIAQAMINDVTTFQADTSPSPKSRFFRKVPPPPTGKLPTKLQVETAFHNLGKTLYEDVSRLRKEVDKCSKDITISVVTLTILQRYLEAASNVDQRALDAVDSKLTVARNVAQQSEFNVAHVTSLETLFDTTMNQMEEVLYVTLPAKTLSLTQNTTGSEAPPPPPPRRVVK